MFSLKKVYSSFESLFMAVWYRLRFLTVLVLYLASTPYLTGQNELDSLLVLVETLGEDTSRAKIHLKIAYRLHGIDPVAADSVLDLAFTVFRKHQHYRGLGNSHNSRASFFHMANKADSSLAHLEHAIHYYTLNDDLDRVKAMRLNHALLLTNAGKFAEADSITQGNVKFFREIGDLDGVALCYLQKGVAANYQRHNKIAQEAYMKALDIHLKLNDRYRIGTDYLALGRIARQEDNNQEAFNYFEDAIPHFKAAQKGHYEAQALSNLGGTLIDLGQLGRARDTLLRSLELSKALNYPNNEAHSYEQLSLLNRLEGKLEAAIGNINAGEAIRRNIKDDNIGLPNLLNKKAELLLMTSQYRQALELAQESVSILEDKDLPGYYADALSVRAQALEASGNSSLAINDLKAAATIRDSLFSIDQTRVINEINTIYRTRQRLAQITADSLQLINLTQENSISKLQSRLYGGGLVCAILLLGGLILFYSNRQKTQRELRAREQREQALQAEASARLVKQQQDELAGQTLTLLQKSQLIDTVEEQLTKVNPNAANAKQEINTILSKLRTERVLSEDWDTFNRYFRQVHTDFEEKLEAKAGSLTLAQRRLAALVRMRLSNQEIARLLYVQPDSIQKSKYRLKKKLNLSQDDNLDDILQRM